MEGRHLDHELGLELPASLTKAAPWDGLSQARYDVVVVGAGVAGLAFTLRLPPGLRVALLTKGGLGESNTRYAQGGLAAAVGHDDSPDLHEADTLAAGAGLCDPQAVRHLVNGGPNAVTWLLDLGTQFDRQNSPSATTRGELLLGREAAHSRRRVLHAGGDATGAEIERALVAGVREDPRVDVFEHALAVDLILANGRCLGIVAELNVDGSRTRLEAPLTVLANGGAGQLWATTSNPLGATADGLAMAIRAGVAVADLEFAQFHPTVLAQPDSAPFLISEAVRGEGAYLRGADGSRFLLGAHPLAELAPRDVVARAIQRQMAQDRADYVYLDLRHLDGPAMRRRFPTIARELAVRGLDIARDLIPVAPAAHYFMGGIVAGTAGETSLPGLLALGEVTCTGVHGANRLASNSLLEGLVFGLNAADAVAAGACDVAPRDVVETNDGPISLKRRGTADSRHLNDALLPELRARLQRAMSRHVAVVRDESGLRLAAVEVADIAEQVPPDATGDRSSVELRNMTLAAAAIIGAAERRRESRGAHYRADFPASDPRLAGLHLIYAGDGQGWRYGSLDEARTAQIVPRFSPITGNG